MTQGLIKGNINQAINVLIGKCFAINRMLDRGMSLLDVRWKMIHTARYLHPQLAHAFTGDKFADGLSGYQASRSNETIYPATPEGNRDYNKPIDFFRDVLKEILEFQEMLYDVYDLAKDEGDLTTKKYMSSVIGNLVPYTDLVMTLIDLSENFGSENMGIALMDANIEDYVED